MKHRKKPAPVEVIYFPRPPGPRVTLSGPVEVGEITKSGVVIVIRRETS